MKEIGSEFWKVDLKTESNNTFELGEDNKFLMSGRTAIDYVLQDIEDQLKIVYMPDYSCESMIQPFLDNNYKIEYYHVDIINKKYDIDFSKNISIFFAMNYFGFNEFNMDSYIEKFASKNVIIIEDITHKLLSKVNHSNSSNYLICSLRKWFPIISGGLAVKLKGKFKQIKLQKINDEFVSKKLKAMTLKRKYIDNEIDEKEEFLKLYHETNEMIKDYKNYEIDEFSLNILKHINIEEIIKRRKENAKIIYQKLKNNRNLKLLFNLQDDVPLFIPVILNNRDKIRKEISSNNIFLPVHWPKHSNLDNEIFDKELSLICDQRYNTKDIEEYIDKIIKIVGE